MDKNLHKALERCACGLLRPVVRFCLKKSIGIRDITEYAKSVFIDLAIDELKKQKLKVTDSRLCAMTGIQRTNVKQYRTHGLQGGTTQYLYRVIGQWRRDPDFRTSNGRPRVLTVKGNDSEFHDLVRCISTHLHPKAVLFALEQVGAVEMVKKGVKLKASSYIPKGDETQGYEMLAMDADNLVSAVLDNVEHMEQGLAPPNIHVNTVYDNIAMEDVPKIRKWLEKQCFALHQKAERHISKYDLDINPDPDKEGGGKVVLGSFTRTYWK